MKYAFAGGLILGVQILGGFPQVAFYTILGCLAFGSFHLFILLKDRIFDKALRVSGGMIVFLLIGLALAAVQILPTFEFMGISTRAGGVSYAMATYESLHPKELLAFLVPDIFGNAVDKTYWRSSQTWHFWESCGYVGILPLCLLFVRTENSAVRRLRIFFIILMILSLCLALGKFNPLYPFICRLPGFGSFRIPAQIIFLYVFGVAVISGMGTQRILEGEYEFNKAFFPFMVAAVTLVGVMTIGLRFYPFQFFFQLFQGFAEGPVVNANMAKLYERISLSIEKSALLFLCSFILLLIQKRLQWLGRPTLGILIPGLLFVDLYLFGAQFVKPQEFSSEAEKQFVAGQLSRDPVQGRVASIEDDYVRANDGIRFRFPSILGYDPLILKRYVEYILSSQGWPSNEHVVNLARVDDPNAKLLKLLNLKQVISAKDVQPLENDMPYAHMVEFSIVKPRDAVLPFMKSETFDPRNMVVLEYEYGDGVRHEGRGEAFVASCSVSRYTNESMTVKTSANRSGYLVLSEIFYPGWQAEVDGERAPIVCGNYIFRVIPLDKGEHEVHLYFVSWPFRVGGVISIVTLVSAACLVWLLRRRRRDPLG
ncbi:MAG: YfhO family protein [Pseudomonadota bacterium]